MILTYAECSSIDRHAKKYAKRAFAEKRAHALEHDPQSVGLASHVLNLATLLHFMHLDCIPIVQ